MMGLTSSNTTIVPLSQSLLRQSYFILITILFLAVIIQANTIPRSTSARSIDPNKPRNLPPWNASPNIDSEGFLSSLFHRVHGEWETEANIGGKWFGLHEPVYIRQVPGDGACLFHSCTVALALVVNQTHIDMSTIRNMDDTQKNKKKHPEEIYDLTHLYHHSRYLRNMAVDVLSRNPRRLLFLQGNEYLRARDLVSAAASQYDLSPEEYCEQMRQDSYWGGGPEIVALCNFLKRPIHVYELHSTFHEEKHENKREGDDIIPNGGDGGGRKGHSHLHRRKITVPKYKENSNERSQFQLRRMACFGSPKFDRREPLNILSADCRFPDIDPGQQIPSGNHFLALFPESLIRKIDELDQKRTKYVSHKKRNKRAGLRGGSNSSTDGEMEESYPSKSSKKRDRVEIDMLESLDRPKSLKDRFKQYLHLFIPSGVMDNSNDCDGHVNDRGWFNQVLDRLKFTCW
jgi:hypothetical protein